MIPNAQTMDSNFKLFGSCQSDVVFNPTLPITCISSNSFHFHPEHWTMHLVFWCRSTQLTPFTPVCFAEASTALPICESGQTPTATASRVNRVGQ